jgi:hypothetical protein
MESWMVMGGAILLVCLFCPAVLGFVAGVGSIMLLTLVVFAILSKVF